VQLIAPDPYLQSDFPVARQKRVFVCACMDYVIIWYCVADGVRDGVAVQYDQCIGLKAQCIFMFRHKHKYKID